MNKIIELKHPVFIIIVSLMIMIISACIKYDVSKVDDFVSDIKIEITTKSSLPSGEYYNLRIYNGSRYEIKHLEVCLASKKYTLWQPIYT